jgi:hypothetical protein
MKTSRTTLPLGEKERAAIAAIRDHYGLHSDADAIRLALHELHRKIQRAENEGKTRTSKDG